ncbi:hypothetical protein CDIK_3411 [Cucumispora dikerogammari]|nr:hypothetical protein CDIK_3411 [Cucumispora dikerogammari]
MLLKTFCFCVLRVHKSSTPLSIILGISVSIDSKSLKKRKSCGTLSLCSKSSLIRNRGYNLRLTKKVCELKIPERKLKDSLKKLTPFGIPYTIRSTNYIFNCLGVAKSIASRKANSYKYIVSINPRALAVSI